MSDRIRKALLVVALSCAYAFGLFILFGWFNAVEFPWQPYAGKSRSAIEFLVKVPDALAIVVVGSVVATFVVLSRFSRPLQSVALVSAPAAVWYVASSPFIGFQSGFGALWLVQDVVLIVAAPAIIARLLLAISNYQFKAP